MNLEDFLEFSSGQRARSNKKVTLPMLADLSEVKFERDSCTLQFKTDLDAEEYEEVDFLRPKFDISSMPRQHETR